MKHSLDLQPATVSDFRRFAERRLPRGLFDYLDGGAGAEATLRRNVSAFEEIELEQRVMRDVSETDTSIELFGERLSMPLVLAPVGMAGMMRRRAEVIAKRAADRAGIPFCLSTNSICSIEEVTAKSGSAPWFQLYMLRDREIVREILSRAREAGVRTLVFTIDLAVVGTRYRDIRNGLFGSPGPWARLRSGPVDYALHPRWLWDVALRGGPHVFGNIANYVPKATNPADFGSWVTSQFDPSVTWKDIEWLRGEWQGPLVLKGLLHAEDARAAVSTGADGLVVSNHGGRQLDGVSSTAAMLPRIADAVGSETTLLVDGGIRTGQDAIKALALGAKAVMVGRPWVYAVAARGEAGLSRLLGLTRQDMKTALGLAGVPNASDIDSRVLAD